MPALTRPSKFRHTAIIEIGGCPIGLSPSLKYLDASKLADVDRAEIEVGAIEGTCCSRTVRATVEKGLVTNITVDGCADRNDDEPLHPEVQKLLKAAAREAKKKRRGRSAAFPIPVKTFLAKPEAAVDAQLLLRLHLRLDLLPLLPAPGRLLEVQLQSLVGRSRISRARDRG